MAEPNAGANGAAPEDNGKLPADDSDVEELLVSEEPKEPSTRDLLARLDAQQEMIREQNRKLSRLDEFDAKFSEITEPVRELVERGRGAEQRGFARARDEIQRDMRKAVAEADTAKYDELSQQLEQIDKMRPNIPAAKKADDRPAVQQQQIQIPDEIKKWVNERSWFNSDQEMTAHAMAYESTLAKRNIPIADRLKKVDDEMRREFPGKFENPRRQSASAVAASSPPANARPKSKTKGWGDIPEDERGHAKAAFDRIKSRTPGMKEDQYLKDYFKEND